jgi:hypothetical protein
MTGKADFTAEEWELVREGPPTAGIVALMADRGGTFRESWALARAYADARKEHGESELLDALVAEKPDIRRYKTQEEAESQGLGRLSEAVAVLEQKATAGDVEAYRKFALGVAERVAEAHKEGGDQQVSEDERAAIERIASSLYPSASE